MAGTLFAEPPTATMEEAKAHFLAAERLKPDGWKENRQFLAKTNIKLGEFQEAVSWLDKAIDMPCKNPDVSTRRQIGHLFHELLLLLLIESSTHFLLETLFLDNFQDDSAQDEIQQLLKQYESYR